MTLCPAAMLLKRLTVSILVTGFHDNYNVYSTRSTEDITLNIPFAHPCQNMYFLCISRANAWNMLPGSIRKRKSLSGFKFALKRKLVGTAAANS